MGPDDPVLGNAVWVHYRNSKNWTKVTSGSVKSIFIQDGTIYGLGMDDAIWKHSLSGSRWRKITQGSVKKFVVHGDDIFGLGMDNAIWKTDIHGSHSNPKGWTKLTDGSVTDF